tara:strand:- start:1172 stop:1654 length:483 start_codon:yes stop_codon:yes gene_type:complete
MEKQYLNDIWSLYFHDNSTDWNNSSFKQITTIGSVEDFCKIYKILNKNDYWLKGMFFIFREDIMPRWEDKQNINGGCFSYKILTHEADEKWFNLCGKVLSDSLSDKECYNNNINGISITPKKNANIIRIWLKDNELVNPECYNINTAKFSTLLYKKHTNE